MMKVSLGRRILFIWALLFPDFVAATSGIVNAQAKFTQRPSNPTVGIEGKNVSLAWKFHYDRAVTFRKWSFVRGNNIVIRNILTKVGTSAANPKMDFVGRITFHSSARIVIEHLKRSDGGYIACIVEFDDGVSMFDKIALEIKSPPMITLPPYANSTVLSGGSSTMACEAEGGLQPIIQWFLNGVQLIDRAGVAVVTTNLGVINNKAKIRSQLHLSNVQPSDNGRITCVASNKDGQDRVTIDHVVYCVCANIT